MASETIEVCVEGKNIIEAVKAVAEEVVIEEDYIDGKQVFNLGQSSGYPYKHIRVTGDDGQLIDPKKTYQSVTVAEHAWDRMVYAVGYGRGDVIGAVKNFAQALRGELFRNAMINEAMITFEFESSRYECPSSAYEADHIVLPDGRLLAVGGWLESLPPKPASLQVVGKVSLAVTVNH